MAATRALARAGAYGLVALLLCSSGLLDAAHVVSGLRRGANVPKRIGEVAAQPLGSPALAPSGEGGYSFIRAYSDGSPVTFDPCRRLHYVVRAAGEPPGGGAMLDAALREVARATGLKLVDEGATDEAPAEDRSPYQPERYGDRWAPVLIGWSEPGESPRLASRVLGRAGPDVLGTDDDRNERFVSGMAVFNGPQLESFLTSGNEDKARAVLLHELATWWGWDTSPTPAR